MPLVYDDDLGTVPMPSKPARIVYDDEPQTRSTNPLGRIGAAADSYAQGMFTPWINEFVTDPIAAGLASAILTAQGNPTSPVDLYPQAVKITEDRMADNFDKYPATSIGSSVVGGVAGAAKLGGTALGKTIDSALRPVAQRGLLQVGEKALRAGVVGASAGGIQAAGAGNSTDERIGNAESGLLLGGVLGASASNLGSAVSSASKAVGKALKPALRDGADEVVKLAQKWNIPLGVDDLTDSKFYKTLVSAGQNLPFSGAAEKVESQLRQLTRAVSRTIGLDTDRLTPEAMDDAFTTVGQKFDNAIPDGPISVPNFWRDQFRTDVRALLDGSSRRFSEDARSKLQANIDYVLDNIGTSGPVDGAKLRAVRAELNSAARETNVPGAGDLIRKLEEQVIDLGTGGSKAAKDLLTEAKKQWRNLLAVEPIAAKDQVGGLINPALLTQRVRTVFGRQFARGKAGDLGEIARVSQLIKETVPNSGTAQRQMAQGILTGNVVGALPVMAFGGLPAVAGQAVLSGAGLIANKALQSRNFNPNTIQSILRVQNQIPKPQGILGPMNSVLSKPIRVP